MDGKDKRAVGRGRRSCGKEKKREEKAIVSIAALLACLLACTEEATPAIENASCVAGRGQGRKDGAWTAKRVLYVQGSVYACCCCCCLPCLLAQDLSALCSLELAAHHPRSLATLPRPAAGFAMPSGARLQLLRSDLRRRLRSLTS